MALIVRYWPTGRTEPWPWWPGGEEEPRVPHRAEADMLRNFRAKVRINLTWRWASNLRLFEVREWILFTKLPSLL